MTAHSERVRRRLGPEERRALELECFDRMYLEEPESQIMS